MLNWSSPGLLGVDQKGSGHYILDEGHLGKFQSIWGGKIMWEGEEEEKKDLIRSKVCDGVGWHVASGLQACVEVYNKLGERRKET